MSPNAHLAFAHPDIDLDVRAFAVRDGLSQLFDVTVTAGSLSSSLDLAAVVGHPAAFRLRTDSLEQPYAVWSGICVDIEQTDLEEDGISIYALRIVPMLWRCKQRRNYRVFQHLSTPEIVSALLAEWGIDVALRLDETRFPKHEYRVQYGESDYDFMSRLLEEDGITYLLEQVDPDGKDEEESEEEEALPAMLVVLSEAPAATGRRFEVPIPYQGNTDDSDGTPHVRKVRIGRSLRPGRFSISSYDYRSSPELRLLVEARAGYELEERYEQHHHAPGAFLTEGRDETTQGLVVDEALGGRQAALGLERLRTRQRRLSMITNQLVIAPGCLFYLEGYPRPEIKDDTLLIATSRSIQGEHMKDWTIDLDAGFAADPIRPPLSTPKPRVMGVESALVVGPEGEEIHCDALGRVKIQFFWDRYGEHDEHSSCFVRVSQAWAGSGYGFSALPRIGHEVLVDFIEGDPDHPVIVGRAHHRGAVPPDTLPKDKTKTTWRSSSTPGGEGYNEISMNDARGEELLAIRAQKDLSHVVLGKEDVAIGIDLSTSVRGSEKRLVGRNQELEVKGDRTVQVDGNHSITTTRGFRAQSGRTTGLTCEDGKLVLTNGQASIVFDGPSIYVDTTANLRLSAGRLLSIYGRQVDVDGRPDVYINSGTYVGPDVATLPISTHSGEGGLPNQAPPEVHPIIAQNVAPEAPGGMKDAEFDGKGYLLDLINDQFGTKLKWPKAVKLPKEWDEQLEKLGRIAFKGNVVKGKLMDPATYQAMKDRLEARLEAEKDRVKKLVKDFGTIVHDQSAHYEDTFGKLKERLSLEKVNLSKLRTDLSDIFNGKKGNFIDSAKALGKVLKEQWNNVKALKKDLTAVWEEEVAYFNRFKEQWKQYSGEVKQVVQDFKDLINDPKDALLDIVFGEDKELAHDIANLADELGYGDQVSDFLGLGDAANVVPPPNPSPPMPNLSPGGVNGGGQLGKATGFGSVSGNQAMSVQNKAATLAPTKASEGLMKTGGQGPQAMTKGGPQALTQQKLSGTGPSDFGGGKLATTAPGLASGTSPTAMGMSSSALAQPGQPAIAAGSNHADFMGRQGGLAANDFAKTVQQGGPAVLQSPSDGQLLIVPKDGAKALDQAKLQGAMVQAQMSGQSVDGAIASALQEQGYGVYKRPWGDWWSPFVEAGESAAATV